MVSKLTQILFGREWGGDAGIFFLPVCIMLRIIESHILHE
jgi:hypothetical protein